MQRSWFALAALVLNTTLALADVRVVGPTGAPYSQIQAAVDAANDGDVVLVRTGTYASFVIRNQEVAVVADTGAVVNVDGAIRVSGVGATRTVLLSGLKATGRFSAQTSTRHGLFARNCSGSLRVVGCELRAVATLVTGVCLDGQGAWIESCADVALVGCTLQGSDWTSSGLAEMGYSDGGHGCYAKLATLALYDSSTRGGRAAIGYGYTGGCAPPPATSNPDWGAAGEGFRGEGGFAFASNCTVTGADGFLANQCSASFCLCASPGANAFVHNAGPAQVHLLANTFFPGAGGVNTFYPQCGGIGPYACAYCCPPLGDCTMPGGSPIVGTVDNLTGGFRRLSMPRVAREQQSITVAFTGQPGDQVELLSAERTGFQFLLGARGVLLVRRSRPQLVLQVGTIGTSGVLAQTWTVGELGPGTQSRTLYLQATMRDAGGQTRLSSPATIVLLDSAF